MADAPETDARLTALALALVDGRLTPAQAAELEARLTADPAAAEAFVDICYLDGLASEALRDTYRLRPVAVRPDPAPRPVRPIKARLVRPRRWPYVMAGCVAASAVAGLIGVRMGPQKLPPEEAAAARVVRTVGCQWVGRAPPLDRELQPGDWVRVAEGVAELQFGTGVRVTAHAGTDLTVPGAGRVRVTTGLLTADVPPAGIGFRVETPAGDVVDRGTWFRVRVDPDGATVGVFEGAVDVYPAAGGEARVKAPESVRFDKAAVRPDGPAESPPSRRLLPGILTSDRTIRPASAHGPSIAPDGFKKDLVTLLQERTDHALSRPLTVRPFRPGGGLADPADDIVLPAGKRVHSYLLHTGPGAAAGQVRFAAPVLGAITTGAGLAGSDAELTAAKFEGWPAGGRGLDAVPADRQAVNSLWLGPDRKSLWVRRSTPAADEFRVLLDAEE